MRRRVQRRAWWIPVIVFGCSGAVSKTAPSAHASPAPETPPRVARAEPAEPVVAAEPPEAPPETPPQSPPAVSEVAMMEAVGPPLPTFPAREAPYKLLILGDSMAATDFGRALEKRLDKRAEIEVARRGKSATGLARPDYFDWMAEGSKRVTQHDPDLVVVIIGGNDGQDLIPKSKDARPRRVIWNSDDWEAAYAARVTDFCLELLADHRRILWLELPVMEHRSLERKLRTIRRVQVEALNALIPRVTYVPTRAHFVGEDGKVLTRVKVPGYRATQVLRQEDGIHFTVPGSQYFAARVAPDVLAALGLGGSNP